MAETFERSIVFTHAEISVNEETYTKSDFVTMAVTINQKRDKFPGVMFGDDIDSTYKKAWKKVLNPPRLNIYVPVKVNETKEFAPHLQTPNPDDNRLNSSDNIEIRGNLMINMQMIT